jgi:hypothetical protein
MATTTSHSLAAAVAIPDEADSGPTFCGTCKRRSDKGVSATHLFYGGSEAICVCHAPLAHTQSENDAMLEAVCTGGGGASWVHWFARSSAGSGISCGAITASTDKFAPSATAAAATYAMPLTLFFSTTR